jgi:hypothetical protein
MPALLTLLNYIPYKREGAAILAFLVLVIQGWNSMAPELGFGPCLNTPDQIADALNAATTCTTDYTLKIPDTINNLIIALLGAGVAAGKSTDMAKIMAQVKPAAQTAAFKETQQ